MTSLSRRSFFAAVMGAVGASTASKLPKASQVPFELGGPSLGEFFHYMVWDSAVVQPGEVLNQRLLPPPMPKDFVITGVSSYVNPEARVESLSHVLRDVSLRLSESGRDMLQAPLWSLPISSSRLIVPFRFQRPKDFGLYLHSFGEPVSSTEPVTVQIIVNGLIRLSAA